MGDEARPPIPDLLAQRARLRKLALLISRHPEEADELVQEALLVAMERPPRFDADPAAWMRGVLRRLWFRRRGHVARTRAAELDSTLPADAAPAEADLERAEVAARLARLMEELEAPYRTVVRLRFYEERPPSEIAALLGRPVNTITSQLARGLARLRERLERRDDGRTRRSPWLVFFWRRRTGADEHDERRPTRRAGTPALASRALVAAALVLVSSLLLVRRVSLPLAAAPEEVAAVEPPASPRLLDAPDPVSVREAREGAGAMVAAPDGWIELEIVDHAGEPMPGVFLEVTRAAREADGRRAGSPEYAEAGVTDASGRLRFPLDANVVTWHTHDREPSAWNGVDWIGLSLSKEGLFAFYHWLSPRAEGCSLRLQLRERSAVLRGRIRDAEGRPTRARLYPDSESLPEPRADGSLLMESSLVISSNEEGDYEVPQLSPGFHTIWVRADGHVPRAESVDLARGGVIRRDLVLHRGAALAGMVLDAQGLPVRGALVRVWYRSTTLPFPVAAVAYSGPDGDYRIEGIHHGPVLVIAQHPVDPVLTDAVFLDTRREEEREWVPVLSERQPLRVRVRTSAGRALGRCVVRALRTDPADGWNTSGTAD